MYADLGDGARGAMILSFVLVHQCKRQSNPRAFHAPPLQNTHHLQKLVVQSNRYCYKLHTLSICPKNTAAYLNINGSEEQGNTRRTPPSPTKYRIYARMDFSGGKVRAF